MAAMAATRLIWDRKLVIPSSRVLLQTDPLNQKSAFAGRIVFILPRYQMARTAVTT